MIEQGKIEECPIYEDYLSALSYGGLRKSNNIQ